MRTFTPGRAIVSCVLAVIVSGVAAHGYAVYFAVQSEGRRPRDMMRYFASHGDAFALAAVIGGLAGILVLVIAAGVQRVPLAQQWPLRTNAKAIAGWLAATAAAAFVLWPIAGRFADDRGARVFVDAYRSSSVPGLQWAAVAVLFPALEELVVRGTLLPAFAATRMGARLAVVLTAALWALGHAGRHPVALAVLFTFGLLLGTARLRSGSLAPPLAMHMAWNGVTLAAIASVNA